MIASRNTGAERVFDYGAKQGDKDFVQALALINSMLFSEHSSLNFFLQNTVSVQI